MTTVTASAAIDVPVHVAYQLWTRFEELPTFMTGVESVRLVGERRLRWVISGSSGPRELTTTIVELRPDECIAWVCDSGVRYAGAVSMEPLGPMRSRVTLTVTSDAALADDRLGAPGRRTREDLDRFRRAAVLAHLGAVDHCGIVLDLGDAGDLAELRLMGEDAPATIICLWRDGIEPPPWFEAVALTLARRSAVVALRYGVIGPSPVGGPPGVTSVALTAAVRGAFAGALASRSPGYREVVVRERLLADGATTRRQPTRDHVLEAG